MANGIRVKIDMPGRVTLCPKSLLLEKWVYGKKRELDLPLFALQQTIEIFCNRQGVNSTYIRINVIDKYGYPTNGGNRLQIEIGTGGSCNVSGTKIEIGEGFHTREVHPYHLKSSVDRVMVNYGFSPMNRFTLCAAYTGFTEGQEVQI